MNIVVIGGMNLDILGFPAGKLLPRDSNPGTVALRPGGVGRNIAQRLREQGADVHLITALGNDERESMLRHMCAAAGIDLSLSLPTDRPSPCYLCIHDETGDMAVAVNDMSAMNCLTAEAMESRMSAVNAADGCVLDCNLPEETLLSVARHASVPLILDPVSCAKAGRAKSVLPFLTAVKPNLLEVEALTGEKNVERAAEQLLDRGVKNVFISLGARGVYFAGQGERGQIPALPLPAVPLTGAGDALCAGITLGLLQGMPPKECAQLGQKIAHQALLRSLSAEKNQ